ncbi:reverse transcriptase domain-containing protein [Tanacetum coccineum]
MGRNMEVNADNMVIKNDSEEEMMADITETLERLWAINLNLNPKKCSFGVEEGIYSGHLITKQGIRADPSKTKEADEAFRRMKECLESLPTMVIPTKGETLTMYLATLEKNVSAILMAERGKKQIPIYFETLKVFPSPPDTSPQRQTHKQILAKPEKSARIAKWAIELGEHEIEFKGRKSIKGQILADFLAETPLTENREAKNEEVKRKEPEPKNAWKLFTDGASSSNASGSGLMVVNLEGKEYTYALRFEFKTTNNEAEFEALLAVAHSQRDGNTRTNHFCRFSASSNYLIEHIKREQNKKADALSKLASMTFSKLAKEVLVEVIQNKSITEKGVAEIKKETTG